MATELERQIDSFLQEKQRLVDTRRLSRRTVEQYRHVLTTIWLPWANSEGLYEARDCTDAVMERFQDSLLARPRPLSVPSIRTYIRNVRVLLTWADVAPGRFRPIREPERLRDPLTREEIQKVEKAARSERDRLIVRALADTGVRISELLGLRLRDLREDGYAHHYFMRVIGKGDREREVGIPKELYRRLRALALVGGEEFIFCGGKGKAEGDDIVYRGGRLDKNAAEKVVKAMAKRAGIQRRVHPHLFRHGWITQQLRAGKMNLIDIQRHVGHRTLAMISQIYAHTTPNDSYEAMMAGMK